MIVYKYCRWNKFTKRIFTANELYLGCSSDYNDPFEYAAELQWEKDSVIKTIKRMPKWKQNAMRYLMNQEKDPIDWFFKFYKTQVKSTGMSCFSECFDNTVMWAHYADNHKGICIAFDTDLLEDKDIHFYKVKYRKKPPIIALPWSESKQIRHQTTKYIEWKYEQEIRAIKQFDKEEISKEERIWHINKKAIVGLFLGCKIRPWKSDLIKKVFDENNFQVPVAVMQVSQDTMKYKLVPIYIRK